MTTETVAIRGLYARLYFRDDSPNDPQLSHFELCVDPACEDVLGAEIDAAFVSPAFVAELLHAPSCAYKAHVDAFLAKTQRSELAELGVV